MEIAHRIQQHPFWHVMLAAVLPRGKPEQYETNVMLASFPQKPVDRREVELPGLLFNPIPVDRYFDRVGMQVLHGSPIFWMQRPGALQAQVLILYTQYQEWSIVHEQSEASVFLQQPGNRTLRDLGVERSEDECGRKSGRNSGSHFHLSYSCVVLGEYAVCRRFPATPGNPGGAKTDAPPGFEQTEIAAPSNPGFTSWLPGEEVLYTLPVSSEPFVSLFRCRATPQPTPMGSEPVEPFARSGPGARRRPQPAPRGAARPCYATPPAPGLIAAQQTVTCDFAQLGRVEGASL